MEKRGKRELLYNLLLYAVFAFYLLLLAAILFRSRLGVRSVNLAPFRSIAGYFTGVDFVTGTDHGFLLQAFALDNLLGNVVIFIPLGVYVTVLGKNKGVWRSLAIVLGASMGAEILQVAFLLGVGDIDDVILNGIGGLLGILLCKLLYRLSKDRFQVRYVVAVLAPIIGALSFLALFLRNF